MADLAVQRAAAAAWSEGKHETETQRQHSVRQERLQAGVQEGCIAPEALGPNAAQQLEDFAARETARQAEHNRQKELANKRQHRVELAEQLQGQSVFCNPEALQVLDRTPAQWASAKAAARLTIVQDRALASIFVVLNPMEMGDRNKCVAAMTGAFLCTPEAIVNPPGAALKAKRSMTSPWLIFLSQMCQAKHSVMVNLMLRLCNLAPAKQRCRWIWHKEADGQDKVDLFLSRAQNRIAKSRGMLMVSLLTPEQQGSIAYQQFPNQMTLRAFLDTIFKVDTKFTFMGICGK